jgi:lysozyme
MFRIAIKLFTAILISFIVICLFWFGYLRFNYPDRERFPVRGIDISHHQGKIDWVALKNEKLSFVYIKATEGADFKDQSFKANWQSASKNNMTRGAYHFFSFCKTGKDQAQNFIHTVNLQKGDLPPAVDLEFIGNCSRRLSKTKLLAELADYDNEILKVYGVLPIYYVTEDFYEIYLKGSDKSNPIWARGIYRKPDFVKNEDWIFWQYSDLGLIKGVKGKVDLNIFNGSKIDFEKIFKK